jgi:hypothetical protein
MANTDLLTASKAKQDEFYTQLPDIEKELRHYRDYFKGKSILCNCDDPYESNFFKYFAMNFNHLGLNKLIATCYTGSPIAGVLLPLFKVKGLVGVTKEKKLPHLIRVTEVKDENGDGSIDLADVEYLIKNRKNVLTLLKENGDFRSLECINLLKDADVIVTNPPFSLFRQYMAQLITFQKKFIIIGNINAVTYKETFELIKQRKVWLGISIHSGDREFRVPDSYPLEASGYRVDENGIKYIRVKGIRWFTNIDLPQRHEKLTLYKKYSPEEYPHYVNYEAIEVSKVSEIPYDYDGPMGVPITFLDKYDPDQFEIIGSSRLLAKNMSNIASPETFDSNGTQRFYLPIDQNESKRSNSKIKYRRLYDRIVIRKIGG